ncbi:MAG: phosphate ABC transporter permease [Bacteroidetes bacterium HGW-Bacteroidetes-6]|jgi:phosphate transport system permease protein|nr:MAG: phosphate ABC transporter permease [Bacteroidetes bacterium HGW-Bacteroidetes-6]
MKLKRIEETFFRAAMITATIIIVAALGSILFTIVHKGITYMNWDMISSLPKGGYYFGKDGGVLNAIVGSLYLALGATLLALFMSVPVALYMNVFLRKNGRAVSAFRFFLDVLWGIPSIVYGAFGFTMMLAMGIRTSLMAGIAIVGVFIAPIMIRAMDEVLQTVPSGIREAAYCMGCTKTETAFRFFLRKAAPGIVTAILLAFGRAIGDAAVVLLTTGYTDYIPTSLNQPVATLPLAIFFQLGSPVEEVQGRAYASALILTVIILIISIAARLFSGLYNKHSK